MIDDALERCTTEQRNAASADISSRSALEIVTIINAEDCKVAPAVGRILPEIAALAEAIAGAFKEGGRLFYIGAGTSGRLGVLDASECPPTYGTDPALVQGLIAGGPEALTRSLEAVEDDSGAGKKELEARGFNSRDVLVGITASGQAPYVLGGLEYARSLGAVTGAISCNRESKTFALAEHKLYAGVGPEVVTGSTRMKSGTAQKLILNMLTTTAMIRWGRVYKNLMVDMKPVNQKLVLRAVRMIRELSACSREEAETALEASGGNAKTAVVMVLLGTDKSKAEELLARADGRIGGIPGIL
ncbi:MAG: N-acetylmuramic acid 6-phosphate etherase [Spirochaetaceae bacterium]|jgi:N-acetylmuramic acid 6-phosphate etherase|nr:N-acetylmuramic acid 6-phosphate etherase [Spirochaetaceae bacterium]